MEIRRLPLIAALCVSSSVAQAQPAAAPVPSPEPAADDAGPRTLLDATPKFEHNGWYVGPTFGVTTVDGHLDIDTGIRGAWIINRTFAIGLAGYEFGHDGVKLDDSDEGYGRTVQGGYGGLLLQYILGSKSVVHGVADVTVGAGGACVELDGDGSSDCKGARGFFVVEPTANVELNVATFMRIAVGGGYRLVVGPKDDQIASSDLSGMVVRTTVAFGEF